MKALRTSMGPSESETLTPSEAEYSIFVACGEMNVQPGRAEKNEGADGGRRNKARFHGSS